MEEDGFVLGVVENFVVLLGWGVSGCIDGVFYYFGNYCLVEELGFCLLVLEECLDVLEC